MKVAFISARAFGLRGTTGTYKLVDKSSLYHDIIVFSRPCSKDSVFKLNTIPFFPFYYHQDPIGFLNLIPVLRAFNPRVIHVFIYPEWPDLIIRLKDSFPQSKLVLDIRTPLLLEGEKKKKIQSAGSMAQMYLDALMTHSKESVQSWIPKCKIKPLRYPIGVDLSMYNVNQSFGIKVFKRFVYVSTLDDRRLTKQMITGFVTYAQMYQPQAVLHIFGSGPELPVLEEFVSERNLKNLIQLRGLVQENDLISQLQTFDAGIAWVPKKKYNDAPSLKILEYMAAGLPVVATKTNAHAKLLDQGFSFDLCDDNAESMAEALKQLSENGFSKDRILTNLKHIRRFDFDRIIAEYFHPVFKKLVGDSQIETISSGMRTSDELEYPACLDSERKSIGSEIMDRRWKKKPRLNIFLLCPSLAAGKGGAERVATEVADEMTHRGHLVYLCYKNRGAPAYTPRYNEILVPFDHLAVLKKQIHDIDPDVFFVFYFNRELINFYFLVHETKIPFGMQECTNPLRLCENNWWNRSLGKIVPVWERELIASAAARIRLTMHQYTQSFPDYIRPQIRAYSNPAFPVKYSTNPNGSKNSRKTIININGFRENKNLITLLRAFAKLSSEFPDWDVKVVGQYPDDGKPINLEILKFIRDNDLTERVIIRGPTDDIDTQYIDSQIHVIASLSEGCPTVVLEAMSVGLPSIGFADCPGTNELIRHEVNGLLAAAEDKVKGLEAALRRLMSSPELCERLGRRAFEDSKAFEPQKIYDQWEQLFYEAADYKNDPERLMKEQMAINPERALHAKRMRFRLLQQFK